MLNVFQGNKYLSCNDNLGIESWHSICGLSIICMVFELECDITRLVYRLDYTVV